MKNLFTLVFLAMAVTCAVSQSASPRQMLDSSNVPEKTAVDGEGGAMERVVQPAGFPSYDQSPAIEPNSAYLRQPYIGTLSRTKGIATDNPRFFNRKNLLILGVNLIAQTAALLAIQSDGGGSKNWSQSQGRTLDPFEKHFESYGYAWGVAYRYGGLVGLNTLFAYMAHRRERHNLEHTIQIFAIGHALASTGYALSGSK